VYTQEKWWKPAEKCGILGDVLVRGVDNPFVSISVI
jgi:hypothetical protein